jgi:hypothetical protein
MFDTDSVEHVNVKVLAQPGDGFDPAGLIPVFQRWIRESVCPELTIDVADYRHVWNGPGIVLIGHEANYSYDLGDGRPGLLYNRKAPVGGPIRDKLLSAYRSALRACLLLEDDPELDPTPRFDAGRFEVILNDRLLAPNAEETRTALKQEIETAFTPLFATLSVEPVGEPRERVRFAVSAGAPQGVGSLLAEFAATM